MIEDSDDFHNLTNVIAFSGTALPFQMKLMINPLVV